MGGEFRLDPCGGVGLGEVDRQHQRPRTSRRGDFVCQGIEPGFAPRDQHEVVAMGGEHARQRGPAWISQTYRCIGAENLKKLLCCNNFSQVQEHPDADRVYVGAVCI
jgi:hypothetical protein